TCSKMIEQVQAPVVEVHDLTASYHQNPVLWNVDLSLPAGALVGILGPNGAGESTLIKAIMGLLELNSGYVKLFNQDLDQVRDRVSYGPQGESGECDLSACALDVVIMGTDHKLGFVRRPGKKEIALAMACLEEVNMAAYAGCHISELSGGQQQRGFLARSLA